MKLKIALGAALLSCVFAYANQAQVATTTTAPNPQTMPQMNQHYMGVLPQNVQTQIQKMYPGAFIVDIDYEMYGWEIKLNNYMELFFDKNGNLLGQTWDD